MHTFTSAFSSEWLKTRHSAASWLVLTGAFFVPLITLIISFNQGDNLPGFYQLADFWERSFLYQWQSVGPFLLPMGVILATSLIAQTEFRNNSWKLVHVLPQSYATTYAAKLLVVLVMMLQFFVLFNIGIYISSLIPALVLSDVDLPAESYPWQLFSAHNLYFYLDCLPIIALQFMLSLRFRNFVVPVGAGFACIIATLFAVKWKYGYLLPYSYTTLYYFGMNQEIKTSAPVSFHWFAAGYFVLLTVLSYVLYRTAREKG
ncbi:MAG: ABC transporter permease [Bacteroidota bacterium]